MFSQFFVIKNNFHHFFKFLPPLRHSCLCIEKVRATAVKNWYIFKRLNTILNNEILLNLIRNKKCLTDQFQLYFCFCIGNTKQLYLFLYWHNTTGVLTENVLQGDTKKTVIAKNRIPSKILFRMTQNFSYIRSSLCSRHLQSFKSVLQKLFVSLALKKMCFI